MGKRAQFTWQYLIFYTHPQHSMVLPGDSLISLSVATYVTYGLNSQASPSIFKAHWKINDVCDIFKCPSTFVLCYDSLGNGTALNDGSDEVFQSEHAEIGKISIINNLEPLPMPAFQRALEDGGTSHSGSCVDNCPYFIRTGQAGQRIV
jgi:hypothetical protein